MAKETAKYIEFNGKKYTIPDGSTAKDTFESLKMAIPEMSNGKLKAKGINFIVETKPASKG